MVYVFSAKNIQYMHTEWLLLIPFYMFVAESAIPALDQNWLTSHTDNMSLFGCAGNKCTSLYIVDFLKK